MESLNDLQVRLIYAKDFIPHKVEYWKERIAEFELTVKQEAIHGQLFKDRTSDKFFTVDIYRPYTTSEGCRAYYIVGSDSCVFTEDVLMTAIYKGSFNKGLTNIIACKSK